MQIPYRAASGLLHLMVDSRGIKFSGEGEWKVRKHGDNHRWQWRKVNMGIDAETLEIRAVKMTGKPIGERAYSARSIGPNSHGTTHR